MVKLSNDQNIKNLKLREKLRIGMIVFYLLTIILALLNLFGIVNIIFPLLTMVIACFLSKKREKTIINRKDDLKEFRDAIKENKKKFGKK